jgi:signal transduction histidine kinase
MGELTELFNDMTTKLARTRELEAQLYNAEKAIVVSRLASAIAHEIRNPLNYINLTLDHLRAGFSPADPQKQDKFQGLTSQLKTEVARINQRITEFLNYSRPPKLEPSLLNVSDVARDALRTVQVQASENNIETTVEEVGGAHSITADAESIRSALTNLVINSLQAMDGEGGKIASTKDTGTGLGLAIVRKAIDDHHGTISVKSKEGEGTTFTITLPVSEPPAVAGG